MAAEGVGIVEVGRDPLEDPGAVVGLGGLGDDGHQALALVRGFRGLEGRLPQDDAAPRLAADADAGVVVAGQVEPDAVAGGQDEGRRVEEQSQAAAVAVEAAQFHLGVGPDAVGQPGVAQAHHEQVLPAPGPHPQVEEDGADAGLARHRRRHQVDPVQVARLHPLGIPVGRGPVGEEGLALAEAVLGPQGQVVPRLQAASPAQVVGGLLGGIGRVRLQGDVEEAHLVDPRPAGEGQVEVALEAGRRAVALEEGQVEGAVGLAGQGGGEEEAFVPGQVEEDLALEEALLVAAQVVRAAGISARFPSTVR